MLELSLDHLPHVHLVPLFLIVIMTLFMVTLGATLQYQRPKPRP